MPTPHDTLFVRPQAALWLYQQRDVAITRAVLGGVSCTLLTRIYDLPVLRLHHIVRKTCARLCPDWKDDAGYPYAWSVPINTLCAHRDMFLL